MTNKAHQLNHLNFMFQLEMLQQPTAVLLLLLLPLLLLLLPQLNVNKLQPANGGCLQQ
jgi:hypothetical protein